MSATSKTALASSARAASTVAPDAELLASLHEEALILQRVIDDLQDLAAADAGTLRLHREPVRAARVVAFQNSPDLGGGEPSGTGCPHEG
ncbi:hypothetical protein ACFYZE_22775 [Streptomyces sp. NPDC001796]|uniref:hypothetical protein n=1 Tax=Streptomyces sp. NPDC001796 TaxID=3364609 RepID=UPI0036B69505